MRAVVVEAPGGPDVLTLAELPEPTPDVQQIVVAVEAAGVNPVDVGNRMDNSWAGLECPYVVGYEFAGTVADVNGCDTDLSVGDPVWGVLPARGTRWGAYAERVAVDVSHVAPRPTRLDAVSAAVLPLAGGTAIQTLRRLDLPAGAWLLVYGASGGVGHLLTQLAAARGINVVAVSGPAYRTGLLDLGARLWLDRAESPSPAAAVTERLGQPIDAAVDLVGGQLVDAQAYVRPGGQLATIVDLAGDFDVAIDRNLTIHGVLLAPDRQLLDDLSAAVEAGVRPIVRGSYPLAEASVAHERMEAGGVGGKLAIVTR
ncbi:MAG TPA: NADP-dependent oxidoreductase [Micromonosporaceae bacterium]